MADRAPLPQLIHVYDLSPQVQPTPSPEGLFAASSSSPKPKLSVGACDDDESFLPLFNPASLCLPGAASCPCSCPLDPSSLLPVDVWVNGAWLGATNGLGPALLHEGGVAGVGRCALEGGGMELELELGLVGAEGGGERRAGLRKSGVGKDGGTG